MSEAGAPGGFGGGGFGGGGPRGPRRDFDRGGRGRDDREPRGPMSVKARLRAKARKKARKAAKKKGGFNRKKVCRFCAEPRTGIDYKDPKGLRYFVTETGRLIPSRISGNCAKHQREIGTAIKRARHLALLPFASQHAG
jgi:small subunit ribosomal protein S18